MAWICNLILFIFVKNRVMIKISKVVDNNKVNEKLDIEAIKKKLPPTERDLNIILVATKTQGKPDRWMKEGKEYISLVLDYNKVLYSTYEFVLHYCTSLIKAQGVKN